MAIIGTITQLTERKEGAANLDMKDWALGKGGEMIYLNDIEQANEYLKAATFQCIWRTNGCCWSKCKARDYCEPDKHGLETVDHLGRGEGK